MHKWLTTGLILGLMSFVSCGGKGKPEKAKDIPSQVETESQTVKQAKAESQTIKNAILEVQVLKVYQPCAGYTAIDVRVTNKSNQLLHYWEIEADIFDHNGEYLAHDYTNGNNLRPGRSVTARILIPDVRASEIASWKLSIGDVVADFGGGELDFNAKRVFELKEIK